MELAVARGRISGPVAILALIGLLLTGAAYAAGFINTLGYESRHATFSGFASGTRSGTSVGLKHMLFFEGQTFYAAYDAEVRQGSLRIGILETFGPIGDKPHFVESVTGNSRGEVVYRIPKTSVYSIYFEGSVLGGDTGRGYDVSYTVRWGAR